MENITTLYMPKGILTMDDSFHIEEAMIVFNAKIFAIGKKDSMRKIFDNNFKIGKKSFVTTDGYIYPGFFDAHCHFLGYSKMRLDPWLLEAKSPQKVVKMLKKAYKKKDPKWILGRGWDQNNWKQQPSLALLDAAFPQTPVYLKRVDGHAAWVNTKAMELANVNLNNAPAGGEFVMENGKFTGIVLDNACDLFEKVLPIIVPDVLEKSILLTVNECLKMGVTSITDAGLEVDEIKLLLRLQKEGKIPLFMDVMFSNSLANKQYLAQYKVFNEERFKANSAKVYLDGALGSHGALLKKPYCDKPNTNGLQLINTNELLSDMSFFKSINMPVCVHAIGDSAAAIMVNCASILQVTPVNRWRMEHAQIVNKVERDKMAKMGIIASVQPTHATSDGAWAVNRICESRMNDAYAYRSLLASGGMLAIGTDFPVEPINPLGSFSSAVFRVGFKSNKDPFRLEQSIKANEALLGMTRWAAYAANCENITGSLQVGRYADFVVLNGNLLTVNAKKLNKIKVLKTFIKGNMVYSKF